MDDAIKLSTHPYVDTTEVEPVLREIQAVLKSHGCAMVQGPDCMILAKVISLDSGFAIASVYEIKPDAMKFKPVYRPAKTVIA